MAEADPAKEHLMLCKVLDAKLDPPSPDLAELAGELQSEGLGTQLNVDLVERVIMAKLKARALLADRLKYIQDCNKICDEVRRDAKFPVPVLQKLPMVLDLLHSYAAFSITTAELFGFDSPPSDQAAATLQSMWVSGDISFALLLRIAEAMQRMEEDGQMSAIFTPLLTAACQRLQGRDLTDQKLGELNHLTQVCSSKGPLTRLLIQLPIFRPPPMAAPPMPMFPGMGRQQQQHKPGEAYRLQTESCLGFVLSPTPLDTAMHKEKSSRHMYFQNITRKSQPQVTSSQSLIRSNLGMVQEQAGKIIKELLHKSSGEDARKAVLEWFGTLITGSECRSKGANQIDEGGGPSHFIDTLENSSVPIHQNLDMRLQVQIMKAQQMGFATPGMAMNTFWCLMELVKPIKMAQVVDLDPFYVLREEPHHKVILGGFPGETRFGDTDQVEGAKELARANGKLDATPKTTAQMFWLALRAVHVLFVPVMKEDFCYAVAASHFQSRDKNKMEQALGEHFVLESILECPAFLQNLASLLEKEIVFLLSAAFPERAADIAEAKFGASILPTEVSSEWHVLPACVLEDIVEILDYYTQIRTSDRSSSGIFSYMKPELLLFLVTFMLGSGDHVKNPSLRGKAANILMSLNKQPEYMRLVETNPVISGDILPACVKVFTAVEKMKQSYYDIRMHVKYQVRIPIMELFEKVLPLERHKQALKSFAVEHSDDFLRFLNQMMNDATAQLEEGMEELRKVRKIVREGGDPTRPPAQQVAADEQNAEGQDIYGRSRDNPTEHCKIYMKMGNRTIRTLWSISREAPDVIVSKLNVLQQMLHNCLNPCLDRLVGPRCLELKGESKDFETFNFYPKELLQFIAEMYVFVSRSDKLKVQRLVLEDGRSYNPRTFQKAVGILRRERVIPTGMLTDFEEFVTELNALAASQEAAIANVDIPDNYLDPIMQEIMEDPVLLPSNNIMDRKVIERQIMTSDEDPFTKLPLKVSDLVPQPELRAEIHEFCAKHGIKIGDY
jgi:hypothetical protein|eukprot:CAMPEP_0169292570 /NCGR_PEP_ID=MMETSP1016-20121227/62825_1 /TAXON_ID=342587 /ORGANISM="Karlodinium micrum, Strain CCMP2283" /LENGTH=1009 /DNA_ID=CAMNT_0009383199 /DNA_START=50 /DNA_END=3079 /DNA_ORIENTATION=+